MAFRSGDMRVVISVVAFVGWLGPSLAVAGGVSLQHGTSAGGELGGAMPVEAPATEEDAAVSATEDGLERFASAEAAEGGGGDPGAAQAVTPNGGFTLWEDYPGAPGYDPSTKWYNLIKTNIDTTFTNEAGQSVAVNMGQHGAIHLFADPQFLQGYDDKIRAWNPDAKDWTGTTDRCGWPDQPASTAPKSAQYQRQSTPMHEDFSNGLDPATVVVARVKGCCDEDKYAANPFAKNINVATDTVNGVEKNVLALTAHNVDDPNLCPGPSCHKIVSSTGAVATAGIFASGRYEVIAKVPASPGLVWAVWTFTYSEHLPHDCSKWTCWCADMPSEQVMVDAKCEFRVDGSGRPCKFATVCDDNTDGWSPSSPPPAPAMSPAMCGAQHKAADPQFLGNSTFGGWETTVNHEIDIEIPANCANTDNVCNEPGSVNGSYTCVGRYNTLNMNNYIYSQNSGTGPAYSNMCASVTDSSGDPVQLLGDGKYHNYTIVWHTSPKGDGSPSYTEFYIDGNYVGTNNVFSPTRGGRLTIAHWGPLDKNALWNGRPNNWQGGVPGDGKEYNSTVYISEINVTPFNEDNDVMYPNMKDLPDGCTPTYHSRYPSSPDVCHPVWTAAKIPPPTQQ